MSTKKDYVALDRIQVDAQVLGGSRGVDLSMVEEVERQPGRCPSEQGLQGAFHDVSIDPISWWCSDLRTREPTVERVAGELADYFKGDNPRFDRERFLEACGLSKPTK